MIAGGDTSRNYIIGVIDNYIDSLNDHNDIGVEWKQEESLSQEVEPATTTDTSAQSWVNTFGIAQKTGSNQNSWAVVAVA